MSYIKQHKIVSVIILLVVLVGGYFWYKKTHATATTVRYLTQAAATSTVISSVTGTGQVAASDQIDIKPQTDGQLISVPVVLNQQVKKGQTLGIIDQQSAANNVAQAKASLEQAQANYDKLLAGATTNAIQAQQLSITSAQQALDQAKTNLQNVTQQQTLDVSKAYNNWLTDNLEAVPSDNQTTATVAISGSYTGTSKGQYTISLYSANDGLHYNVSGLGTNTGLVQRGLAQPMGNGMYITFSSSGTLFPFTTWTVQLPNPQASNYVNDQNAYNAALQSQTQALQQAQASIDSAQNNLDKANNSYQTTVEPPTQADIDSAKAQITSAQAQLDNAETAYQNTILTAPFDGTVAALAFATGDKITAGTTFATIITPQQIAKITLNEVDVAKVKVGQKATMTFDAIDGLQMTGTVAEVDTIGSVSQGVVTYGVQIAMDGQDDRIKPSMSVSVSIITQIAADALTVPSAAVKSNAAGSYVQILDGNGKPQNVTVVTGISDDTNTVITSGLSAGQQVVTQTITTGTTAASATTGTAGRPAAGILGGLGGGGARVFTGGGGAARGN